MPVRVIVGFAAVVLIVVGALIASWLNVKGARSPHERRFTLRSCIVVWSAALFCLTLAVVLPRPWAYIPVASLLIIFPVLTYRAAYRRQLIREVERRKESASTDQPGS